MSRIFWTSVGAVGGIYAYRRTTQAWDRAKERAKERGLVGSAQVLMGHVRAPSLTVGGFTVTRTVEPTVAAVTEGERAQVIDITEAGRPAARRLRVR